MLTRFLLAQDRHPCSQVLSELQSGRKAGHWIWYIFPQMKGLGMSRNSEYYGMEGLKEAREYLAHPVMGARLRECCKTLLVHAHQDIRHIMGSELDAMKLRSSMTLFIHAAPEESIFREVLDTFFYGKQCKRTNFLTEVH